MVESAQKFNNAALKHANNGGVGHTLFTFRLAAAEEINASGREKLNKYS